MAGQDLELLVTVHDWNRLGPDVLLGLARIPVSAADAEVKHRAYTLYDANGGSPVGPPAGQVLLSLASNSKEEQEESRRRWRRRRRRRGGN